MNIRRVGDAYWYHELSDGNDEVAYCCERIVYQGQSRHQKIDIVDSTAHGRMLFLDGVTQSAEADEFIYHEVLVHPPLLSHPAPRSVLIIGGAEGATLREVFRHRGIRRVVMVDIDEELIRVAKTYLGHWHQGSYDDQRLELVIGDGRKFLEESSETFDAIIVDLSDPLPDSPAVYLFTQEFYRLLSRRLSPLACAGIQGESVSPQDSNLHVKMVCTLRTVFPVVQPCLYFMPSFYRPDAHILVTNNQRWSPDGVAQRLRQAQLPLRYLSPPMVKAMCTLPPYLLQSYQACQDIITDARPNIEKLVEPLIDPSV